MDMIVAKGKQQLQQAQRKFVCTCHEGTTSTTKDCNKYNNKYKKTNTSLFVPVMKEHMVHFLLVSVPKRATKQHNNKDTTKAIRHNQTQNNKETQTQTNKQTDNNYT